METLRSLGAPHFFQRTLVVTPEPSVPCSTGKCPVDWEATSFHDTDQWHIAAVHAYVHGTFQCSFQSHGAKCTAVCKVVQNPVQQIAGGCTILLLAPRRCNSLSVNKTRALRSICIAQEHFHVHLTHT